jgi:hypothetical protein
MNAEDIDQQVEDAVRKAQELDGFKQGVLKVLRERGEAPADGRIIVVHMLNGWLQVDDLS